MEPPELTVALTPEEAKALENGLAELTFNTGTSDLKAWRAIQVKLQAAQNHERTAGALASKRLGTTAWKNTPVSF